MMSMTGCRSYVLIAFPLFAIHVVEEYLTGAYALDPATQLMAAYLNIAPFAIFAGIATLLFLFLIYLLYNENVLTLLIFGLALAVELSHPIYSLVSGSYFAVITSIPLIVLSFFFWKKFLKERMLT